MVNLANAIAALLTLLPFLTAAFFPARLRLGVERSPAWAKLLYPALLCAPYLLVACHEHIFRWAWLALYAVLPVAVAALSWQARAWDPEQRGNWRDYLVLAALGLPVDLRWFEGAWPAHLAVFNKLLLLDAGIYALLMIRRLDGVGFDLRLTAADLRTGVREFLLYAPLAIPLGLGLGFLHFHALLPTALHALTALSFTFFFIAAPEELFFRGWLQNLLQRRMHRTAALVLTAALFGLAHWNKRTAVFNWRYVLLAAIAGIFYGRAWRRNSRVGSSAVTHSLVDTVWSIWLR